MAKVYMYVVARDFGFAPNPFHGVCTLATCKPKVRNVAQVGDWVIGVGGGKLGATGRCIFGMRVTRRMTFNEYWLSDEFKDKKPVRNGSKKMMLGDNIYFKNENNIWSQAHSHHSLIDGTLNQYNLTRDTSSNYVLASTHFYYFGNTAPLIPAEVLKRIEFENRVGHRTYTLEQAAEIIRWLEDNHESALNLVSGDPYNFDRSEAHYSVANNRITQ